MIIPAGNDHICVAAIELAASDSPLDCRIKWFSPASRIKEKQPPFGDCFFFYGAGDEARTRYLHLGKVALYRMSYTRISRGTKLIIAQNSKMSIPNFENNEKTVDS